ncbi:uncharacterized [Tachysurus ichikawai]
MSCIKALIWSELGLCKEAALSAALNVPRGCWLCGELAGEALEEQPQEVDWGYYGNKNNPKVPLQESNLIQNRASDLTSCKTSNRWRAQENTVTKDRIVGSL